MDYLRTDRTTKTSCGKDGLLEEVKGFNVNKSRKIKTSGKLLGDYFGNKVGSMQYF